MSSVKKLFTFKIIDFFLCMNQFTLGMAVNLSGLELNLMYMYVCRHNIKFVHGSLRTDISSIVLKFSKKTLKNYYCLCNK